MKDVYFYISFLRELLGSIHVTKLRENPRKGKVFNRRNNRIYPGNSWMPIVSCPNKQLVHIKRKYQ